MLELQLFGVPRIVLNDQDIPLPLNKPVSLLAYLAFRNDWVSRDELLLLYYPDIDEKTARHRLRQIAYRAKKYGWANKLELNDDSFRWLVKTDLQFFQEALKAHQYSKALEYYHGEFLKGLSSLESPGFEAWLELKRSEFLEQYLAAVLKVARDLNEQASYHKATLLLKDALEASPFSESLVQTLMYSYSLKGEMHAALDCFARFCKLLKDELALEPSRETLELVERIRKGEQLELQTPQLPLQLTPFVGREAELKKISELLLDDHCRLISLLGMGGMGKTRLSLEAARQQLKQFKDGVFFVPLASISSSSGVVAAIADSLGFKVYEQAKLAKQLLDFLRHKHVLLVLDNVEQVLAAGLWLKQLLESSSQLKLLLSSREPLNLRAEHILKISGLDLPKGQASALAKIASVQLFTQSAKRLKPELDFQAEQQTIADICHLVGGMPLALELAASWISLLSPREIKAEIERDLGFLTGEWQDVPERHKNIERLLEASWKRLDQAAQATLMALSLFTASFAQEDARALSQCSLSSLLLLEQRALLNRHTMTSFEMHPLLRSFVGQKLAQDAELCIVMKRRMCEHYAKLLESHKELIYTRQQEESLSFIESRLADAIAALSYAAETLSRSSLETLADVLYAFYLSKTYLEDGFETFANCVNQLEAKDIRQDEKALVMHLRCYWLFFAQRLAKDELVNTHLSSLSDYFKTKPESPDYLLCLLIKIDMSYKEADYPNAKASYLELLKAPSVHHKDHQHVVWLGNLGNICSRLGQWQEAQEYYEAALDLAYKLQIPRLLAKTMTRLGDISADFGHYDQALDYYQEGLGIFETLDAQFDTSIASNNLATVHHVLENYGQAVQYYQRGLSISERLGDREGVALSYMNLAEMAFDQQHYQEAIKDYEHALGIYREINDAWHSVKSHALVATAYLANQQAKLAQQSLRKALKDALELSSDTLVLEVLFHAAVFLDKTLKDDPNLSFALIWQHPASYEDQRVLIRKYLNNDPVEFAGLELPELRSYAQTILAKLSKT